MLVIRIAIYTHCKNESKLRIVGVVVVDCIFTEL